jgi:hypothetical protein
MPMSKIVLKGLVAAALVGGMAANVEARSCINSSDHGCWSRVRTENYVQVVVSRTPGGTGIACAVKANSGIEWGGILHCFSPSGVSGAAIMGRGGEEAQNPGWFAALDPARRMVSVTIEPNLSNTVVIHALRSDGFIFAAHTTWPLPLNGDPSIHFAPHVEAPPPNLRSIAFVKGMGLTGVTTSNQVFVQNGLQWIFKADNFVIETGSTIVAGRNMGLVGPSGTSTLIGAIQSSSFPPPLPRPLKLGLPDPNASFNVLGRTTPLAVGTSSAFALVDSNADCPAEPNEPCILRSVLNPFLGWRPWQPFRTGAVMPIDVGARPLLSIQDGGPFRGASNEIWAITVAQQLWLWAP